MNLEMIKSKVNEGLSNDNRLVDPARDVALNMVGNIVNDPSRSDAEKREVLYELLLLIK